MSVRLMLALLRRETGGAWLAGHAAATAGGAWVAWHVARAGYFAALPADAHAATPLLARLIAFPSLVAAAVMAASAMLAIVRTAADREAGWLVPLAAEPAVRAVYPAALAAAVAAPLTTVWIAGAAGFHATRVWSGGGALVMSVELLRSGVVAAACLAAAAYGVWLAALLREPALAVVSGAALYAMPLVPLLFVVAAGGEPGVLHRFLTLLVPAPAFGAEGATLLRHVAYAASLLAAASAAGGHLFGRVR